MRHAAGAAFLVALLASACSVNLSQSESGDIVKNQCTSESDCGGIGTCFMGTTCVAGQGTLSSLLFELTPPVGVSTAGIGGVRFLQMEHELSRSSEQHELNLPVVSTLHAYFSSKCRFEATLTPEQPSYGLSASNYVVRTAPVVPATRSACPQGKPDAKGNDLQELAVDLPEGKYNVYLRPASAVAETPDAGAPICNAIPAALGLIEAPPGISCVTLKVPSTQTLDVQIPWPEGAQSLDGWKVDVVHPITGQVLSLPSMLDGLGTLDPGIGIGYRTSVEYSPAAAAGTPNMRQELLRLSPPSPGDGPVIQLSLAALVASSPVAPSGEKKGVLKAVVSSGSVNGAASIGPFPPKVHLKTSVYDAVDFDDVQFKKETPVPSTLTFTATKLDAMPNGIFASFETTSVVGKDGQVSVDLLPGKYRVRVVPSFEPDAERRVAMQETTWIVRASDGDQAGRVIRVQRASSIAGRAFSALGGGLEGVAVQALPGSVGMRRCDQDASACTSQPVGALEIALAESAFVPRSAGAVTRHDGGFLVEGVDCGDCTSSAGALFDVTVRPADGSRLPWIVQPGVVVASSDQYNLGDLRTTLPIVQRGTVQVPQEPEVDLTTPGVSKPTAVPGTLIRAFLLRDASGAPIFDPTDLPSCSIGTYTGAEPSARCIRSALQVAETRADEQGNYELVLPAAIDGTVR